MARTAWPEPPVTLNALSASWRLALAAAHDALTAVDGSLPADELHARNQRLNKERDRVERLLEADALVEHTHIVRHLTLPTTGRANLGLPETIDACIFDLDGVLAPSADLHFAAWADVLDRFLVHRMERASVHFSHYARFSRRNDYAENMHGKPRLDGIRAFLGSRGITLPEGRPNDPPDAETVHGLANAKNVALRARLAHEGIAAFTGSTRYLEAVSAAGLASIVVSASANTSFFLQQADLFDLVDVVVDGQTMRADGLQPKPAPDVLVAACQRLNVSPAHAAAFETTAAGVAAARAARMGLVVGVSRGESDEPFGADRVVGDLGDLL